MTELKSDFESCLFLGFEVNPIFQKYLELVDEKIRSLFIQNEEIYLQSYILNGKLFLGKFLKNKTNLSQIELFSSNIFSLLHKIVPNFDYAKSDLWLIPTIPIGNN